MNLKLAISKNFDSKAWVPDGFSKKPGHFLLLNVNFFRKPQDTL
jgi:hypothetical protein